MTDKNAVSDWDTTADNNDNIAGLSLDGSVQKVSKLDNIIRTVMAQVWAWFKAGTFYLRDSTDETKLLQFSLSGITTGTTRTLTAPDESATIQTRVATTTDNAIARYDGTAGKQQNSGITIDDSNNVAGAAQVSVGSNNQTSALVRARAAGNGIEFGHATSTGYGSMLGAEAGTGKPFLAFNAEAGSTNNTYKTRGIKGTVVKSDVAGGLSIQTVATASADNQTATNLLTLDASGNLAATNNITASGNIERGTFSTTGATAGASLYSTGTGGALKTSSTVATTDVAAGFYNTNGQVGAITVSGSSTSFSTSSDYRLKTNIVPLTGAVNRLLTLKPSRFTFISTPGVTVDGFLAHEVQAVVPEAITGDKDAVDADGNPIYQSIDQSKLVPLLVGAMQELATRVATLEGKVG